MGGALHSRPLRHVESAIAHFLDLLKGRKTSHSSTPARLAGSISGLVETVEEPAFGREEFLERLVYRDTTSAVEPVTWMN